MEALKELTIKEKIMLFISTVVWIVNLISYLSATDELINSCQNDFMSINSCSKSVIIQCSGTALAGVSGCSTSNTSSTIDLECPVPSDQEFPSFSSYSSSYCQNQIPTSGSLNCSSTTISCYSYCQAQCNYSARMAIFICLILITFADLPEIPVKEEKKETYFQKFMSHVGTLASAMGKLIIMLYVTYTLRNSGAAQYLKDIEYIIFAISGCMLGAIFAGIFRNSNSFDDKKNIKYNKIVKGMKFVLVTAGIIFFILTVVTGYFKIMFNLLYGADIQQASAISISMIAVIIGGITQTFSQCLTSCR